MATLYETYWDSPSFNSRVEIGYDSQNGRYVSWHAINNSPYILRVSVFASDDEAGTTQTFDFAPNSGQSQEFSIPNNVANRLGSHGAASDRIGSRIQFITP